MVIFLFLKKIEDGTTHTINKLIKGSISIFSPYIGIKGKIKEKEITKDKFINFY
jgi:hypothetical protein